MSVPPKAKYFDLFIDSDGVVADFEKMKHALGMSSDVFKHEPGAYTYLDPYPGAVNALEILKEYDDRGDIRVWIATKTPAGSPYAYSEKVLWYRWIFPWLEDRVVLCHDKSLLGCERDMLFDDRPHKGNVSHFRGKFVHFTGPDCPDWESAVEFIRAHLASVQFDSRRSFSNQAHTPKSGAYYED
jgi:hypothetical protein